MTGSSTYQLFTRSGCLSSQGMEHFLQGDVSGSERERIQKHLDTCILCSDAIEGMNLIDDKASISNAVQDINQRLTDNLINSASDSRSKAANPNTILLYFAAAASVVLLVGLLLFLNNPLKDMISQKTTRVLEVEKKTIPQKPGAREKDMDKMLHDRRDEKKKTVEINGDAAAVDSPEITIIKEDKGKPTPSQSVAVKPNGSSLEAFMESEENHILVEESPGRYPDIASTQPMAYYLAEVTVRNSDLQPITHSEISLTKTKELPANDAEESLLSAREKKAGNKNDMQALTAQVPPSGTGLKNSNELVSSHFFNPVEVMPEFPGGYEGLNDYLSRHLNYPEQAKEQNIEGRVVLSFLIDEEGYPTGVKVIRGIGSACDEESMRVIQAMPRWKPATQNGEAVSVMFTLPVNFNIL